jgi:hypothetical protein
LKASGVHAATRVTRFEALEAIRQGVRPQFDAYSVGIALGVPVRHDHGRQDMSANFQAGLRFLGLTSSPAFVRAPEGDSVAERFIRALESSSCWSERSRSSKTSAMPSHDWLPSIMSSGWSSDTGSVHRLRCGETF